MLLTLPARAAADLQCVAAAKGAGYHILEEAKDILPDNTVAASFETNVPEQKTHKPYVRLRAVSLFFIRHAGNGNAVNVIWPSEIAISYNWNKEFVLPFYYLFLFRLTPF